MDRSGIKKVVLSMLIALFICTGASAKERFEISYINAPSMSYKYGAEGNSESADYSARFSGMNQRMNGMEAVLPVSPSARIGVFYLQGGSAQLDQNVGIETVGDYQTCKLNVGFSNFMISYYKKITGLDMEFMFNISVVRQMYSRKDFEVGGVTYEKDDSNQISGEGGGFGIRGRIGDDLFIRYRALSNFYIEIYDVETDGELGEYFSYELSAGYRYGKASFEIGYMYQYLFMHAHTNRRLVLGEDAPDGAIISWSQQEMKISGAFLRINMEID